MHLTLTNADNGHSYEVAVTARVVPEIGGTPGYSVEIDNIEVQSLTVQVGTEVLAVEIPPGARRAVARYVEEWFDEEIREAVVNEYRHLYRQAS